MASATDLLAIVVAANVLLLTGLLANALAARIASAVGRRAARALGRASAPNANAPLAKTRPLKTGPRARDAADVGEADGAAGGGAVVARAAPTALDATMNVSVVRPVTPPHATIRRCTIAARRTTTTSTSSTSAASPKAKRAPPDRKEKQVPPTSRGSLVAVAGDEAEGVDGGAEAARSRPAKRERGVHRTMRPTGPQPALAGGRSTMKSLCRRVTAWSGHRSRPGVQRAIPLRASGPIAKANRATAPVADEGAADGGVRSDQERNGGVQGAAAAAGATSPPWRAASTRTTRGLNSSAWRRQASPGRAGSRPPARRMCLSRAV